MNNIPLIKSVLECMRIGPAIVGLMVLACVLTPPTEAEEQSHAGSEAEIPTGPSVTNPVYPVSRFSVEFDMSAVGAGLDVNKLKQQPIKFSKVGDVYTQPQPGTEVFTTTLAKLGGDAAKQYDVTALRSIIDHLLTYLGSEEDLVGIVVAPSPDDIGLDLTDRRDGATALRIIIRLAQIGRVRTLGSGDRIDLEERENHSLHGSIRSKSPLKGSASPGQGSYVYRTELDEYLYRLNRHPGRRVDAAISPGSRPGEISLDYLVSENKPWYAYFQLSNTGTDSTSELRQRFGFVHNQFTGVDDVFSIDYLTTGFDESHVVQVGYTRPLAELLEVRLSGLYSNFTADQVGSPLNFIGENASFGGALAYNFYQRGATFIDAVAGLEYYFTSAENELAGTEGEAHFLFGRIGLEFEDVTDIQRTYGSVYLKGSLNAEDDADIATLGRVSADDQFVFIEYSFSSSFYLEPLLNRAAWEDISDPGTSTLAHELAFLARGQWAIADDRMAPTFQAVAGGLYSVRGYEEAHLAGDSSFIATAEYRFHVPRIFGIQAPKQTRLFDRPFRVAPDSIYGRPDWDLILKAFVDYAYIDVTDELVGESDDTLASTGLGIEVSLKNNVNVRADWGIALEDARATEAGHNRLHFVLTLLY